MTRTSTPDTAMAARTAAQRRSNSAVEIGLISRSAKLLIALLIGFPSWCAGLVAGLPRCAKIHCDRRRRHFLAGPSGPDEIASLLSLLTLPACIIAHICPEPR